MDLDEDHLPMYPSIATLDIHGVEADPNLVVTALIPLESQPQPGWGVWPDVCDDPEVSYMEQLIADRQPFTKSMWPGGDTSEPFIIFPTVVEIIPPKNRTTRSRKPQGNHLKLRHSNKKASSSRNQRRISTYFSKAAAPNSQHEQLLGILTDLSSNYSKLHEEYQSLHKLLKRRKRRRHCKRSSFHSLLASSKTCTRSDKGTQTDPAQHYVQKQCSPIVPVQTSDASANIVVSLHHLVSNFSMKSSSLSLCLLQLRSSMEVDDPAEHSPLISQYGAQHYVQKQCSPIVPVQTSDTVEITPEHNKFPVHNTGVINSQLHQPSLELVQGSPNTCSALYDTSPAPLNLVDSPAPDPTSPIFAHNHMNSPILGDPITPTQPKYDSSAHTASRRACLFPLSPLLFTPENSPNKSSDKISGFAVHAASLNAFSATATSKPTVSTSLNTEEAVEVSDGSPARHAPSHLPCMEENYVAKELYRCPTIPAPDLICPLPQIQWDIFERSISKFGDAFHITRTNFAFSNKFLLDLAVPQEWTTTYMETEPHLFKWEDEAFLDEIKLVDAKRLDLLHDVQQISKSFREQLAAQESRLEDMKQEFDAKFEAVNIKHSDLLKVSQGLDGQPILLNTPTTAVHTGSMQNIAVTIAVLGAMAWFYFKLA
ncbi:unnamed protein product [Eruca vesicaria subsp. sativa]|uniref:Uncharacterized protein n=1 Tax=Eruca vesicaria subsp. sativa TaxID=29727 RepID=A0ABC8L6U3_ERUVS|nr:unnamed protein product [Eruca vesicaria subsp. sativa]